MIGWAQVIVALVALQRLGELVLARRNAAWLLAQGGVEYGRAHYPLIVALHGAWLATLLVALPAAAAPHWGWLGLYLLLQGARLWVLVSLGRYWTTRVITVPGAALVKRGPYRYLRHPNYLIVTLEVVVLPLAFGAWQIAAAFGLANALLLAWRIGVEDRALAARRAAAAGGGESHEDDA